MPDTLKKNYAQRQLRLLRERVVTVDRDLVLEARTSEMLLEAMDAEDLKRASNIIDKLRNLKGKGLEPLDVAIEKAETDINRFTGGGPLQKAWSKLKSTVGIDNPLVKIMTFANALENGFKQIPTILKNADAQLTKDQGEKSLSDVIQDQGKQKMLIDNMLKALSPTGLFGAFKQIPYVDKKNLVASLMSVKINNLNSIVRQTTTGPQTASIPDIKDVAQGKGDVETKGTQPAVGATPSTSTQITSPTTNTKSAVPTVPVGQKTTPEFNSDIAQGGGTRAKVVSHVRSTLNDLGIKDVRKVIDALDKLGVIKSPG